MKLISTILNLGIKPKYSEEEIRLYRQVNGVIITTSLMLFTSGIILSIFHCATYAYTWIIISSLIYLPGLYFTSKNNIKLARYYVISFVELNTFFLTLFSASQFTDKLFYFELAPTLCLFPLYAALLEFPILIHIFIALLQLFLFHFINLLFPQLIYYLHTNFNPGNIFYIKITIITFIIALLGIIISIFQKETISAKKKLKDSETKLKQSNTALEQFAYIASHDLQEPLRMVKSYLQLIEKRYKDKLDDKGIEFIDFAVDGAHRMYYLINSLLDYSRLDTAASPLTEVNCETILTKVINNIEISITETKTKITHDKLPTITGERYQLTQLLQNLIINAIKFCKDRSPKIHISAKQQGNSYLFGIHDNGIGIKPEYFENIFTIFRRLHTHEEYQGYGIGLAMCKRIVERHKGKIWVESEIGKGSTFWINLPVK